MIMVTEKQKQLVYDIEEYAAYAPKFKGDINDKKDVSEYISKWKKFLYENDWAITHGY